MKRPTTERKTAKRGSRKPRKKVHNDACVFCGTITRPSKRAVNFKINGERVRVSGIEHRACLNCGDGLFTLEQSRALRLGAHEAYRRKHRLLSAEEIRQLRKDKKLTQGQLAKLLRLGANTISRWESAGCVQTASLDVLLRVVRDVPGSIRFLRKISPAKK